MTQFWAFVNGDLMPHVDPTPEGVEFADYWVPLEQIPSAHRGKMPAPELVSMYRHDETGDFLFLVDLDGAQPYFIQVTGLRDLLMLFRDWLRPLVETFAAGESYAAHYQELEGR